MISANGANTEVKATLIHTSMGPNWASISVAAFSTWAWSATSAGTARAWPPASMTSCAAPSRPAWPRAISPTLAPRAPYSRAVARAMPALAPVMTTVCVMEVASLLE